MDFALASIPAMPAAAMTAVATSAPMTTLHSIDAGQVISSSAQFSSTAARDLGMVNGTVGTAAKGLVHVSPLQTAARFLSRTVAIVVVGASAMQGAQILQSQGTEAMYRTQAGRGAVLGTIGGVLMLTPYPPAQLGAAAILALSAANELGAFKRFDKTVPVKTPVPAGGVSTATVPGSVRSLAAGAIA